jgi:hypothetical protein
MRKRSKCDKALSNKDYLNKTDQSKAKRPNLGAGELETPYLPAKDNDTIMLRGVA